MVQPLPSSPFVPVADPLPLRRSDRPAAAPPLVLPARRSLDARRRRRSLLATGATLVRPEHVGIVLTALVLLGATLAIGWRMSFGVRASEQAPARFATVRVRPGETLWSVVRQHNGAATPERVAALVRANDLPAGARLVPGQTLRVPLITRH